MAIKATSGRASYWIVNLTVALRTSMTSQSRGRASETDQPAVNSVDQRKGLWGALRETRYAWGGLTLYERFEQIISLVLTVLISVVIVAAVAQLAMRIALLVVMGVIDPADQSLFQAVFGMILTVLIGLEFNHSLMSVLKRQKGVVQVRTVVLIALLALVYKFLVIDATKVDPLTLVGLSVAVLALGGVYLLLRGQDE